MKNYQEWLEAIKPYENECKVCKRLVKRLEEKIRITKKRHTGCGVIFK